MNKPAYIIGIDLGTTNSVVAYTAIDDSPENQEYPKNPEKSDRISILEIPQFVGAGVMENRQVLPSFIYIPSPHETANHAFSLPWDPENHLIVGEYARDRGAEVPQRMIASAKSWLCHTMIDRNKDVLPWGRPDDVPGFSPVAASAMILGHIRNAWNFRMAGDDPSLNMENQEIFLTVPASFDAVARELTVRAAEMAGLAHITLLEEPQAAFYSWIASSGDAWRKKVRKGDLVLVCDIGGGTADFSLIRVSEDNGELALERIAVGDHLLVGGDNMDLALAYDVSRNMADAGTRLDPWQMRGLIQSCRTAKEAILSHPDTSEYPVTILGRGSSLIGGTLKTSLTSDGIKNVIMDGFFPFCEFDEQPKKDSRIGLKEAGLFYESDPAVTRHLARFLNRQVIEQDAGGRIPTAVLFNGGVMKAASLRDRIVRAMGTWHPDGSKTGIREIATHDTDLAVARGAAYYGLARRGSGIRIRGGLGKSYYIGVAASMPAVPGMPAPVKALCVAPFGMEEGTDANIRDKEFVLVVGEPVRFDFLGSSVRKTDAIGHIVEDWQGDIEEITTIETSLDGEPGSIIRVTIEIRVTEIGTIELWCVPADDDKQWKLEFNVREQAG
ncbi:MAG: Hsp70 family protein [Desulfobacteraceae bacterium]|nr:MAG: Hsp70 family protein [Desulfobacteraceae bacterium]